MNLTEEQWKIKVHGEALNLVKKMQVQELEANKDWREYLKANNIPHYVG